MANTSAICTSFLQEAMCGIHALGTSVVRAATTPDTLKAALFLVTGSLGAATTTYDSVVASEVSGTNYTAGGVTVTNANQPATSGTVAYWTPSTAFTWNNVTLPNPFDCVLLYNSSQGNRTVGSFQFGGPQTVTSGNFSVSMPVNGPTTALIQLAGA